MIRDDGEDLALSIGRARLRGGRVLELDPGIDVRSVHS